MKRREFLGGVVASLGAAGLPSSFTGAPTIVRAAAQGPRRPNFVFIFCDDQRYDAIRAIGHQPWLRTPNLDLLLTRGEISATRLSRRRCAHPAGLRN